MSMKNKKVSHKTDINSLRVGEQLSRNYKELYQVYHVSWTKFAKLDCDCLKISWFSLCSRVHVEILARNKNCLQQLLVCSVWCSLLHLIFISWQIRPILGSKIFQIQEIMLSFNFELKNLNS